MGIVGASQGLCRGKRVEVALGSLGRIGARWGSLGWLVVGWRGLAWLGVAWVLLCCLRSVAEHSVEGESQQLHMRCQAMFLYRVRGNSQCCVRVPTRVCVRGSLFASICAFVCRNPLIFRTVIHLSACFLFSGFQVGPKIGSLNSEKKS